MKTLNIITTSALLIFLTSCEKEEDSSVENQLIGTWEYGFSKKGSEQTGILGTITYEFKSDKTFIKKLDSFDWRDEGTWTYDENSKTLSLTYKTYTNEVSDTKTASLEIDKIEGSELVFKFDYNDTNLSGEFVEFEFVYYFKK